MKIAVYDSYQQLGQAAGIQAAALIQTAINTNGAANIILATGTSQFEVLSQLVSENIDWTKVTMFHLDEYIALPATHPASFRKYLYERFVSKVGSLKAYYLINGEAEPKQECERLGEIISKHSIDVVLIGIGENSHLAFNDPPADFKTEEPFIVVNLDEACQTQQMNEGWFTTIDDVPKKAISMSIRQILKSKNIICSVPDKRKAVAVKNCLGGEVNNLYPASILQTHANCFIYLDKDSASLLQNQND